MVALNKCVDLCDSFDSEVARFRGHAAVDEVRRTLQVCDFFTRPITSQNNHNVCVLVVRTG